MRALPAALAALIVAHYAVLHPLARPAATWTLGGALALPLADVACALVLLAGAAGIGLALGAGSARCGPRPAAERLVAGLLVGTVALSLALVALGLAGAFRPVTMRAVLGVCALGCVYALPALAAAARSLARACARLRPRERLGLPLTAVLLAPALAGALAPPTAYDALMYHLTVPRDFLAAGAISAASSSGIAHYPLGAQMLYAVAMSVASDRAPAVVHLGFLVATLVAVALLARQVAPGRATWLVAALLIAGTPHAVKQAGTPYVDLALAFAAAAGFLFAFRYRASGDPADAKLAALAAGLAVAVKHLGGLTAAGVLAVLAASAPLHEPRAARALARWALIALVAGGAWYAKSAAWTLNPLYPAGNRAVHAFWSARGVAAERLAVLRDGWFSTDPRLAHVELGAMVAGFGRGRDPLTLFALPYRVSVDSADQDGEGLPTRFLGEASPLFLALFVLGCGLGVAGRGPAWAGLALFAATSLVSQQVRFYLPAFVLLAPAAAAVVERDGPARRAALALCAVAWAWGLAGNLTASWNRGEIPAAVGLLTETVYLSRNVECHDAFAFANRALPRGSRMLLVAEGRTYRLAVPHETSDHFTRALAALELLLASRDADDALARLRARGFTHLYLDRTAPALLQQASADPAYQAMLAELLGRRLARVYLDGRGIILALPGQAPAQPR